MSDNNLDYIRKIKSAINFFTDIIFPIECLGCGKEGKWICERCASAIPINRNSYCLGCKTKTDFGEFCDQCESQYNLSGVFIASDYDNELIKKTIKALKYRFVYGISRELSRLLILFMDRQRAKIKGNESLPRVITGFSNAVAMPVPLHKKRQKWRGFNQAEKLAAEFAKHFRLELNTEDLRRVVSTKSQAKLSEAERKKNLIDSLAWRGAGLAGRNIIIVDDVTTTGSTLEECAKVLKRAGAGEVWGLVVAKG
ncbi:hypothetical protein COT99_04360 [Candidatus Falkowbacteria bacterium CG10_big_fil_rev_8_21_14_0_10_43_10]|uniref:Phosphoribosyltransferase domain-containing protein n=1 Tax=Candidatus Falkowbacteria bacterium CG10_big_fil_rev_8_21_14_0_10_43_10 TaxID=1974567 RepID=A0A2H0V121_9BACT|nr:MAG: hypothetical protein COT99_04360 [Candidatus Falkowbacteria bacterium CG10_big_fil_rev_8_21_14_0_10_43_10]